MTSFSYVALDARGRETRGEIEVSNEGEALRRLKEMGVFPTRVRAGRGEARTRTRQGPGRTTTRRAAPFWKVGERVKPRVLIPFTRQMATLLEAGMSLTRGLKLIREQDCDPVLRRIIQRVVADIEGGSSFSEALVAHPKVFNGLYVQLVKAGELSGALDAVLARLATFMEKAQRLKSRVTSAMFYPCAVITVAVAVMGVMLVFVVPRFEEVFSGLLGGRPMPPFTQLVLGFSKSVKEHIGLVLAAAAGLVFALQAAVATPPGRALFDRLKLRLPGVGPVIRKAIIARVTRTLGTLLGSGVPILQALHIVRETAGNTSVRHALGAVHDSVKEGESMTLPLRASGVFPAVVTGLVDVGEQTGALPEMLLRIADNYDEEVDTATAAMTSLLEPVMIVFLALVVGAIVIALFLPIIDVMMNTDGPQHDAGE